MEKEYWKAECQKLSKCVSDLAGTLAHFVDYGYDRETCVDALAKIGKEEIAQSGFVSGLMEQRDEMTKTLSYYYSVIAKIEHQRDTLADELRNIRDANWRKWDEEVRSPHQFVAWSQNRARYALEKVLLGSTIDPPNCDRSQCGDWKLSPCDNHDCPALKPKEPLPPIGMSNTDWIKMREEQHPLSVLHINQGSMDAAADAYEAEYNAAKNKP